MKRLISITMDTAPPVVEDDKKVKSKDREKVSTMTKVGRKAKGVAVLDG